MYFRGVCSRCDVIGQSWCWRSCCCIVWSELPEKSAIPQCGYARSIILYTVLIMLFDLYDHTRLVPAPSMVACLVLYVDVIANFQWWELLCVFRPSFVIFVVTLSQSFLPSLQSTTPFFPGSVFSGQHWCEISNLSPKDYLSWRKSCDWIWCISVL